MSVDLSSRTTFERVSLVLMDDCLIKLEHGRLDDRVRRFMYDSIESVIIWRKLPWLRILLCLLLIALPGGLLLLIGNTVATVFGIALIVPGVGVAAWYFYCKTTTIRIVRAGTPHDIVGMFRPGKLRRFNFRLVNGIRASQATLTGAASPPHVPEGMETEGGETESAPAQIVAAPYGAGFDPRAEEPSPQPSP